MGASHLVKTKRRLTDELPTGAQIPYDEAHPCSVGFRTSYAEEGYESLEEFRFVFLPKFLSGSERRLRLNGGKFFVGDSVQYSTLHCRVHH